MYKSIYFVFLLLLLLSTTTIYSQCDGIFLNEIHYDNASTDVGEFIEVAVPLGSGLTLSEYAVHLYNGSDGTAYGNQTIDNFTVGTPDANFEYYYWEVSGIQNGAPDGFGLSKNGNHCELLSYEGTFTATGSTPATGIQSTDILVEEGGSTLIGESLQLSSGAWTGPVGETKGTTNVVSLPSISIDDVSMNEGDMGTSTFTFTVTLSMVDAADVTFDINTNDGSATTGDNDYVAIVGGMGTITAGMTTTTIEVTVNGDTNVESIETFEVILSNVSANANILNGNGTGTILNDDGSMTTCPNEGDVIITEIMQNPAAVSDNDGEYFEVYNTTGTAIDIDGWLISDNGTESHVINNGSPLNVPANGYLLLSNNGDNMTNGGLTVDYEYSSIFLGNGDDEIILTCDPSGTPTEIDRVEYDGGPNFPDPTGASMSLNPNNLDGMDNDTGSNWCESTSAYGSGDLGTPGTANDACGVVLPSISVDDVTMNEGDAGTTTFTFTVSLSAVDAADVTFDINTNDGSATTANNDYVAIAGGLGTITAGMTTTTIDVTVNGDTDVEGDETFELLLTNISANATISDGTGVGTITNDDVVIVSCPNEGDVIISEIMQNPDAVGDTSGEYFEVYNTTGTAIDIDGWSISDNGTDNHIINNGAPLNVPANGFLVLSINGDMGTNGGITVDYEYGSFTLSNGDDEIIITCDPSGTPTEIDRVEYDGGPNFPDPTGASMILDPNNLDGTDNDSGVNWCESTSSFGSGDLGTPGTANDACGVILPSISINDVSMNEGDMGTTTFTFTVTLSAVDASDVTFDINTIDGTATTADNDYVAIVGGMGTITAGMTSTTIDVTVNGDTNNEGDETFELILSNISANATISDGSGLGTILSEENNCPAMWNLTGSESGIADYETSGTIISDQIIQSTAMVDYDAVIAIELNPGFEVELGAVFNAFIDGCNNGGGGVN